MLPAYFFTKLIELVSDSRANEMRSLPMLRRTSLDPRHDDESYRLQAGRCPVGRAPSVDTSRPCGRSRPAVASGTSGRLSGTLTAEPPAAQAQDVMSRHSCVSESSSPQGVRVNPLRITRDILVFLQFHRKSKYTETLRPFRTKMSPWKRYNHNV